MCRLSCLSLCVPSTKLRVGYIWCDFVTLYQHERYGRRGGGPLGVAPSQSLLPPDVTVVQRHVHYGPVFISLHNYSQFLEAPHGGGPGAVAKVSPFINTPLGVIRF